ncbi:MAG: hypothetical protein F6K14_13180 [Symploca sp. SIO2C1]|nr:hypothetical protein [Symploca sp. SIO2C1]
MDNQGSRTRVRSSILVKITASFGQTLKVTNSKLVGLIPTALCNSGKATQESAIALPHKLI